MDLTMLWQLARRGRLAAFLNNKAQNSPSMASLTQILQQEMNSSGKDLDGAEVAKILTASKPVGADKYRMLLQYLNSTGQQWRSNVDIPHPPGALILPPVALQPADVKLDGHGYSCRRSHEGNSAIQFKNPTDSASLTGFIEEIWRMPLQGDMQTFLLVRIHKALPASAHSRAPYTSLRHFETTIVDAAPSNQLQIIEPHHITTHLTVYKRPKGTYGINKEILVICWAELK